MGKPVKYTGGLTGPTLLTDRDGDQVISYGDIIGFTAYTDAPHAMISMEVFIEGEGKGNKPNEKLLCAGNGVMNDMEVSFGLDSIAWQAADRCAAQGRCELLAYEGNGPKGPIFSDPISTVLFEVAA